MTVDWRELQRWGVSEKSLPPGSVVRFRQPSFWEVYKWYAIGLVASVIIEALLIAGCCLSDVSAGRQKKKTSASRAWPKLNINALTKVVSKCPRSRLGSQHRPCFRRAQNNRCSRFIEPIWLPSGRLPG